MHSDAHRSPINEHLLFRGRPGDPRLGELVQRGEYPLHPSPKQENILLWGCPDDAGVVRNRGRAGAKEGPDSIRKHLYRMTPPMDAEWESLRIHDFGNLVPGGDLRETHRRCREEVAQLARTGGTIVALGGGHDFAAPNFLGFLAGLRQNTQEKIRPGLVNIDPHLDVRELEEGLPHSGTPFREILESGDIDGKSFVQFGTRANRNSRAHFKYCIDKGVKVHPLEELRSLKQTVTKSFREVLHELGSKRSHLAVTFDMDVCSDAEGTSAAPVIGFSAQELCRMAELCGRHLKVSFLEIAEVAPPLDPHERSSRIAAEVLYSFLRARSAALLAKKK